MASNVSEKQAREVAEESREAEWKQPSFGREMYLGNFQLDLIHPQPKADPDGSRGRGVPHATARVPHRARRSPGDRGDAKIGDDVIHGLKRSVPSG